MKNIIKFFCVFIIISLFINIPVLNASGIENKGFNDQFKDSGNESKGRICDYDGTEILKEVSQKPDKDGNYEITLTVKGKPKNITKPVDILLIMDASNSMGSDMKNLKDAMNSLVDKVVHNIPNSRIGVIAFGTEVKEVFSFNNRKKYNSDETYINEIKNSYKDIRGMKNTNIEGAWRMTDKIFKEELKKVNSNKNVIFFTDGCPSVSADDMYATGYRTKDKGWRNLQPNDDKDFKEGYKYRESKKDLEYEKLTMSNERPGDYKNQNEWALYEYNKFYKRNSNANIFSIGLIDNIKDRNNAIRLLSKMQNSGYFTIDSRVDKNNSKSLKEIYDKIANNIILDKEMAKGLKITDVVSKDFEIVKNGAYDGKNSKIVNLSDNSTLKLKECIDGSKISWDRGENTIDSTDGIQFKFKIKPKDQYWGTGDNKVHTNDIATISYKKPKEKNKTITGIFNKPNLSIPYKLGKIKVTKKFFDENGKEVKVDNKKTYTVCIDGGDLGKYYLKVDGNGNAKVLDFYMRDENTDISNNKDNKLGYLKVTEGKKLYKVNDISTMDSEIKSIFVNGSEKDSFELNMKNNNIDIVINSSIKDEKYFYDNKEKVNDLGIFKLN